MTKFPAVRLLGLAAALTLAGCGSAQDVAQVGTTVTGGDVTMTTAPTTATSPPTSATPAPTSATSPSPEVTTSASAPSVANRPVVGSCYSIGKAAFQRQRDGSEPIACTRRHTAETFAVFQAHGVPNRKEIDHVWRQCQARFKSYVGDSATVSKLGLTVILPSREQTAAGQNWIRCDAIELPNFNGKAGLPRTGSVRGVLVPQVPRALRGCVRHWPKIDQPVHFTSCNQNHQAELIPESLNLGGPEAAYPGLASAQSDSKGFCESVFQDYVPETTHYYYYYPTPTSWRSGSHDTTCWALDTQGDGLPPI